MRTTLRVMTCLFVGLGFIESSTTYAQPALLERVYVSEILGNDNPSCGPINRPCETFAWAHNRVLGKGRIIVLTTGEYGALRITKSLTIEAPPGVNALIQRAASSPGGGTFGIEVATGPTDVVTLRGLKVQMPLPGGRAVVHSSGAALYVEDCVIEGGLFGIDIFPFSFSGDVRVFVRDSVVSNSGTGLRVAKAGSGSVHGTIERSSFEGCGEGLAVRDGAHATARDSVLTRNRFAGVSMGSSSPLAITQITLESCVISSNDMGIMSNNAFTVLRVSNSTITDNRVGISPPCCVGVQYLSRLNNTVEGNTVVDGVFSGAYAAK